MKQLRVVHLVNNFPPEFMGGTERYVSELSVLQAAAGLEVLVVCGSEVRDDAVAGRDEKWRGVAVRRIFRRHDERYGVEFLPRQATAAVCAAVRAFAPDLVHLHHWFNLGDALLHELSSVPAPDSLQVPVIASFHDAYSACPRFFFLRPDGFFCGSDLPVPLQRCVECVRPDDGDADLAERLAARRVRFEREVGRLAVALAPSEYHADLLVRAGVVPRAKMRALPLGIGCVPPRAAQGAHVRKPGVLRLVTFGNLSRIKGTDLIFEALAKLPGNGAVELHCYGKPLAAEATTLQEAARGLPVTWHGEYDLDRLAAAAPQLDLAVFPSRAHETYSLVVEEAIALGLPMIVSDRGAPARRIAAFGRAVAVEDASSLRATLSELMEHPERLDAMRRALPERPQLLADHERALRDIYAATLAARPGPGAGA
jgi:glycosyltransferase involved in cell wall biosynthesis